MSGEAIEFGAVTKFTDMEQGKLIVHNREMPTVEAILAERLIEKWGMVMCEPSGEDRAGRQTYRLMSVDDVVQRACATAAAAHAAFRARGWIKEVPSLAEITEMAEKLSREAEERRDERRNDKLAKTYG